MSLSDRLRAENASVWEAMQRHRFVTDIESGSLPDATFRRYLVFEHRFVATAVTIFGQALVKAPGLAQQRHFVTALHGLTERQLPWFETCFAALGMTQPTDPSPAAVLAFDRFMARVADGGGYAEIVAIILAAEWMYETWCARVAGGGVADHWLAAWVSLHVEPPFRAGVAWLRAEMDRIGEHADEATVSLLSARFGEALRLEIGFHEAAYGRSVQAGAGS